MVRKINLSFWSICTIVFLFMVLKTAVILDLFTNGKTVKAIEYVLALSTVPFALNMARELVRKNAEIKEARDSFARFNNTIVSQADNDVFYEGDVINGAKSIIKGIVETLLTDTASVWVYLDTKDAIVLQSEYLADSAKFVTGKVINKPEFPSYFRQLKLGKTVTTDGAHSKMLIPIWYIGNVIGMICVESVEPREWKKEEIDFVQILSSLYSFAHSVRKNNMLNKDYKQIERFVDVATLVSKSDALGKITYVNRRFEEVSGWKAKDIIGREHSMFDSGENPPEMWKKMFRTIIAEKGIWNSIIVNKTKSGKLYYVDAYVKAEFNSETGVHTGFTTIQQDITDLMTKTKEIEKKNSYLEYAAKIIRHDMHSGINTYIPRGLSSLKRRLTKEQIESLNITMPIRLIEEGLHHTQKIYNGVYEFTNLVKKDGVLNRTQCNLQKILGDYLDSTAYRQQVIIEDLGEGSVNEPLFCTAVDNLIRNGLRYNDSPTKVVKLYRKYNTIYVEDNGRGLSQEDFKNLAKPYIRRDGQKETGTGLGLNICLAILDEHKFSMSCELLPAGGTQFKISLNKTK